MVLILPDSKILPVAWQKLLDPFEECPGSSRQSSEFLCPFSRTSLHTTFISSLNIGLVILQKVGNGTPSWNVDEVVFFMKFDDEVICNCEGEPSVPVCSLEGEA